MKGIILVSGRISAISVRINVRIISAYEIGVFLIVVWFAYELLEEPAVTSKQSSIHVHAA